VILIIDDEETVRDVVSACVRTLGYKSVQASDGLEGVARFTEFKDSIACVLVDLTMPRLDGEQTLREILTIAPSARVILMSGYNLTEIQNRFGSRGFAGFIQKPFTLKRLGEAIKQVCAA
jgi:CheY-like chemotaxis protein